MYTTLLEISCHGSDINDFIGIALNKGFIAVMVSRYLKHITSDLVHEENHFYIITTYLANFNGWTLTLY